MRIIEYNVHAFSNTLFFSSSMVTHTQPGLDIYAWEAFERVTEGLHVIELIGYNYLNIDGRMISFRRRYS